MAKKLEINGAQFLRLMVDMYCPKPKIMHTTDLAAHYLDAMRHFQKGVKFKKAGKDYGAYIELLQYANIVTVLRSHKAYQSPKHKAQAQLHAKRLSNAMNELEILKPELILKYNQTYAIGMERTYLCGICYSQAPIRSVHTIVACKHQYCKACLRQYIKSDFCSNKPTTWPQEGCGKQLDHCEDIRALLSATEFDQLNNQLNVNCIGMMPDIQYCLNPQCDYAAILDGTTKFECAKCKEVYCVECRVPFHSRVSCEDFRKSVSKSIDGVHSVYPVLSKTK